MSIWFRVITTNIKHFTTFTEYSAFVTLEPEYFQTSTLVQYISKGQPCVHIKLKLLKAMETPKKETIVIMHVRVQLDFVKCISAHKRRSPL